MLAELLLVASTPAIAAALRYYVAPVVITKLSLKDDFYTQAPEMKGLISVVKRDKPAGEDTAPDGSDRDEGFFGGAFRHAILSSKKHHLNDPRKPWFVTRAPEWEVLDNNDPAFTNRNSKRPNGTHWPDGYKFDDRWQVLKDVGAFWVGLPWMAQIYQYRFGWSEIQTGENGAVLLRTRREWTRYWFANDFPYAMQFDDAKTFEGMTVTLRLVITIRITNPHKALFETDNWLHQIEALVERVAKNYAAGRTYEQLRGESGDKPTETGTDSLSLPVITLTEVIPEEIEAEFGHVDPTPEQRESLLKKVDKYERGTRGRYGITIRAVDLKAVLPPQEISDRFDEAASKRSTAEIEKDTVVIAAQATAEKTKLEGFATAEVTQRQGEAEAAAAKAKLEAYEKSPELAMGMLQSEAMQSPGDGKTIFVGDIVGAVNRVLEKGTGK